jgi:NAD(P)-dependent dehydrogenase (short-subunit alcohol dehydrogenase family)
MNVNLRAMTVLCRNEIRLMLKNKRGPDGVGSIVNFGSWSSFHGHRETPHYTTSKFAVNGLTKCLCVSYASQGLRVNAGKLSKHSGLICHSLTGATSDVQWRLALVSIVLELILRP